MHCRASPSRPSSASRSPCPTRASPTWPRAREGESQGALAPETVSVLHEIGVFRITVPVELGGFASGARDTAEVVRELGGVDASAGWTVIVSSAVRARSPSTSV
ncbi:acyl-CoA dehydrogenase family protein [Streptomyces sp. NBC_00882]|uniref:acyl-CoA dehydrogenase family protein n=1 Tax=Streptomyces TaxID=1883 RepID=UPI003864AF22|nr:acyl-CoA dehydrogenase family protein [Streptomyces sp. NBC_00882]WSZ63247.1 acyl-CoA dehydrogenase family protein [Streptomyces canus]